jgi:hypothetical protein
MITRSSIEIFSARLSIYPLILLKALLLWYGYVIRLRNIISLSWNEVLYPMLRRLELIILFLSCLLKTITIIILGHRFYKYYLTYTCFLLVTFNNCNLLVLWFSLLGRHRLIIHHVLLTPLVIDIILWIILVLSLETKAERRRLDIRFEIMIVWLILIIIRLVLIGSGRVIKIIKTICHM